MSLALPGFSDSRNVGLSANKAVQQHQKTLAQLTSGSKLVESKDDAAGLAVSVKLTLEIRRSDAVSINLQNVNSFIQTQDSALSEAGEILTRISELCTMAQDVTKSNSDVQNYFTEMRSQWRQLRVIADSKFNGIPLFDNDATQTEISYNLEAVMDESGNQSLDIAIPPLPAINPWTTKVSGLFPDPDHDDDFPGSEDIDTEIEHGLTPGYLGRSNPLTYADLMSTFGIMARTAHDIISKWRAVKGAEQSTVLNALSSVSTKRLNLDSTVSKILDTDFAQSSASLSRNKILMESAFSMLTQAGNLNKDVIMRLLGT